MNKKAIMLLAGATLGIAAGNSARSQTNEMGFFVTSTGIGNGANLGGLNGADGHCQRLAETAGSGGRTWRAYLSTQGTGAVNARERIGPGPWSNAKGVQIAATVQDLHSDANKINKETALSERGEPVKGRGDQPNQHDILTGTQRDGTAFTGGEDMTCQNWTSASQGAAMVGHHDLVGNPSGINFWNFSHPSRGCGQQDLVSTGGAGLLYCFATR